MSLRPGQPFSLPRRRREPRAARAHRSLPALWLAALVLAGCTGDTPPNLVLISIDTLRADHLSAYGYPRATSPNIDRLASEGVVFERAWSPANWTLPAHVSMLTGLYPHEHRVERFQEALHKDVETLPEALAPLGYRSAGVVSTVPFLSRKHGLAQGWNIYDDNTAFPPPADRLGRFISSPDFVSSALVHRRAVELLDTLAPGPFFLFLHYFDVHASYLPPPPYDRIFPTEPDRVRAPRLDLLEVDEAQRGEAESRARLYDGEIRWVDHWIGELLAEIERRGLAENTAIVLTADHGEEFFEHSRWEHHGNAYDTSLRVPLIVRLPGRRLAGRRSRATASLVDVPAILLGAAGRTEPRYASGRDLLSPASSENSPAGERDILIRTERDFRSNLFLVGIVSGGYKAIFDTEPRGHAISGLVGLFEIDRDPYERRDLGKQLPELVESLRARVDRDLAAGLRSSRRRKSLPVANHDRKEEESLRALGYL
ncbi:MAG TPA: sulfatase [Thermoanaerobaculia bacterium]|nr:sulfatase [Thermoanaerobaculia bacterium]